MSLDSFKGHFILGPKWTSFESFDIFTFMMRVLPCESFILFNSFLRLILLKGLSAFLGYVTKHSCDRKIYWKYKLNGTVRYMFCDL
jgi:hypothetical protein